MNTKKFLLEEKDIPTAWYNIVADMENKPMPMLNPQTKKPLTEEDMYPLFLKKFVIYIRFGALLLWFALTVWRKHWIHRLIFISRMKVLARSVHTN